MFYSNLPTSQVFQKKYADRPGVFDSYFLGDQIFCGQYWDEFAIPAFLGSPNKRVLMLGLGKGAGIRPLLSTKCVREIVAVDLDPQSILESNEIFQSHFPEINFQAHAMDAMQFLKSSNEPFDLIWVDLYTPEGYADLHSDPVFYQMLSKVLAQDGMVAVNVAGFPAYLDVFSNPSSAGFICAHLSKVFSHLYYYPFRRNQTLVASHSALHVCSKLSFDPELTREDCLSLMIQHRRAELPIQIQSIEFGDDSLMLKSKSINAEVLKRWDVFQKQLLDDIEVDLNLRFKSLHELTSSHNFASAVALYLLANKDPRIIYFPVFIAAYINHASSSEDFSWFIEFTIKNYEKIQEFDYAIWLHYFLPQVQAMIRHEHGKYAHFFSAFEDTVLKNTPKGEI